MLNFTAKLRRQLTNFIRLSLALVLFFEFTSSSFAQAFQQPYPQQQNTQNNQNVPSYFNNPLNTVFQAKELTPEEKTLRLLAGEPLENDFSANFRNQLQEARQEAINRKLSYVGVMSYSDFKDLIRLEYEANNAKMNLPEEAFAEYYKIYAEEEGRNIAEVKKAAAWTADGDTQRILSVYDSAAKSGRICKGSDCISRDNYLRGLLGTLLKRGVSKEGCNSNFRSKVAHFSAETRTLAVYGSEKEWDAAKMITEMDDIFHLISTVGVSVNDKDLAQKYFRHILKNAGKFCDNDTYLADIMPGAANADDRARAIDGKQLSAMQCQRVGNTILSLAMVSGSAAEESENTTIIYNLVKKTYRDDYGAMTLSNGITALMVIGTNQAYDYIEKFLLVESLKDGLHQRHIGQRLLRALDGLSINEWRKLIGTISSASRGSGGRYLNDVALKFQYIDEETAQEWGMGYFSIAMARDGHSAYNAPYGNVLEDIGYMLASSKSRRAQAIANKALSELANGLRLSLSTHAKAHAPLALGALMGGASSSEKSYIVRKMYNLDWIDLNEGTQRRIHNILAGIAAKDKTGYLPVKTLDQVKKERSANYEKAGTIAVFADMFIGAVLMVSLVASLPSIVRSSAGIIRNMSRVRSINSAGKGTLLKAVRANMKASGVNPAKVREAMQAARAQASARSASGADVKATTNLKPGAGGNARGTAATAAKPKASAANQNGGAAARTTPSNTAAAQETPTFTEYAKNFKTRSASRPSTIEIIFPENTPALKTPLNRELTATVGYGGGSGGGGVFTQSLKIAEPSSLTPKWRFIPEQTPMTAERIALRNQWAADFKNIAAQRTKPFEPGIFFNKPYNELPKFKRFIFDRLYFNIKPAGDISSQLVTGIARNPVKAGASLSVPFASAGTQIQIVSSMAASSEAVANTARTYTAFANAASSGARVSNTVRTVSGAEQLGSLQKALSTTSKVSKTAYAADGGAVLKSFTKTLFIQPFDALTEDWYGGSSGGGLRQNTPNVFSLRTPASFAANASSAKEPSLRLSVDYEGYTALRDYTVRKLQNKAKSGPSSLRYKQLTDISPYLHPGFINKLIAVISVNPGGPRVFDLYYEEINSLIPLLKEGRIISLRTNQLHDGNLVKMTKEGVRSRIGFNSSPFSAILGDIAPVKNIVFKVIVDKFNTLASAERQEAFAQLLDLYETSPVDRSKAFIVAENSPGHNWKDLSTVGVPKVLIGKEIRLDFLLNGLKKRGKGASSMKSKEISNNYYNWILEQLKITRQTPGVWHVDDFGTTFIYSNDGSVRFRCGAHETLLQGSPAYHFHIEYRNTVEGNYSGPVNYRYRWPKQDITPMQAAYIMVDALLERLQHAGLAVHLDETKNVESVQTADDNTNAPETQNPVISPVLLPAAARKDKKEAAPAELFLSPVLTSSFARPPFSRFAAALMNMGGKTAVAAGEEGVRVAAPAGEAAQTADEAAQVYENYKNYENTVYLRDLRAAGQAKIKEEKELSNAWETVKKQPLSNRFDRSLVTINIDGINFVVKHGAVVKGKTPGTFVVQGPELSGKTGVYANYGLTKILFKHSGKAAKDEENPITKGDFLKLPTILREYTPTYSNNGNKVTYNIKQDDGTSLIVAFSKINGEYSLVTMFRRNIKDNRPDTPFSLKKEAAKEVGLQQNAAGALNYSLTGGKRRDDKNGFLNELGEGQDFASVENTAAKDNTPAAASKAETGVNAFDGVFYNPVLTSSFNKAPFNLQTSSQQQPSFTEPEHLSSGLYNFLIGVISKNNKLKLNSRKTTGLKISLRSAVDKSVKQYIAVYGETALRRIQKNTASRDKNLLNIVDKNIINTVSSVNVSKNEKKLLLDILRPAVSNLGKISFVLPKYLPVVDYLAPAPIEQDPLQDAASGTITIKGRVNLSATNKNQLPIGIYNKNGKLRATVFIDSSVKRKMSEGESFYINSEGHLIFKQQKNGTTKEKVLVETSLKIHKNGVIAAGLAFEEELQEGVGIAHNKMWSLYNLAIMGGFAGLATNVASLAKDTFGLSLFEATLIQAVGYLPAVLASLPIANIAKKVGLEKIIYAGLAIAALATALPMFIGMSGHMPAALSTPEMAFLMGSMVLLGLGATAMGVATGPRIQASSSVGNIVSNELGASFYKQIASAAISGLIAKIAYNNGFDFSILFPIYTGLLIAGGLAYKKFQPNTRTLGRNKKMNGTAKVSADDVKSLDLLKNDKLVRNSFITFIAHLGVISTMGMNFNIVSKNIFGESNALLMAAILFTLPMALMRYLVLSNPKLPGDLNKLLKNFSLKNNEKPEVIGNILLKSSYFSAAGLALMYTGIPALQSLGIIISGMGVAVISPVIGAFVKKVREEYAVQISGIMNLTSIGSMLLPLLASQISDMLALPAAVFLLPSLLVPIVSYYGYSVKKGKYNGHLNKGAQDTGEAEDGAADIDDATPAD